MEDDDFNLTWNANKDKTEACAGTKLFCCVVDAIGKINRPENGFFNIKLLEDGNIIIYYSGDQNDQAFDLQMPVWPYTDHNRFPSTIINTPSGCPGPILN